MESNSVVMMPGDGCRRDDEGFTLVELAAVTALIAILAVLAVPAYQHYSMRAYRAEAINTLVRLAACQEVVRASLGNYALNQCSAEPLGSYQLKAEPVSGGKGFRLTATPVGRQSQDQCGTLVLNNLGERSISAARQLTANCWASR